MEAVKKAFSLEKVIGQSPVLVIALLFLFYQERREDRESQANSQQISQIIELQKENNRVMSDFTAAIREQSLSIEKLAYQLER